MAIKTRTNLYAEFEDGDTLLEDSFTDLIDSCVNLADTTAQSFASNLTVPNLAANSVSADTVYGTNLFSDKSYHTNPMIVMYTEATASIATWVTAGNQITASTSAENATSFSQTNGVITYTGTVTARVKIEARANIESTVGPNAFMVLYQNGIALPRTKTALQVPANTEFTVATQGVTQVKTSDTLSVYIGQVNVASAAVELKYFNVNVFSVNFR